MAKKNIILSRKTVSEKNGVVVLPLEKWEKIEKRNRELQMTVESILAGELALKQKKTRSFEEFLKDYLCQK